jgi:hypothetical protein
MKLGSCGLEQRIYIKGFLIQGTLPFIFYLCAGARDHKGARLSHVI